MTEKKKRDNLEIEKIKLARLKVYGKIITVLISIGIGTFGVAVINSKLQEKQLAQQALVNEATRQQAEMENLGKFLEHALKKDIIERIRFATYFAKVTIDEKARGRWGKYLDSLKALETERKQLEEQIRVAQEEGDSQPEDIKELKRDLDNLKRQMAPSPKDNEYMTSQKAEDYLILGKDLYSKGDDKGALRNFDGAIKLNPNLEEAWVCKGAVLEKLELYKDALEAYEEAIGLDSDIVDAWVGKGVALYFLGNYDEAIKANNKVLKLKPDFAQGWYNRACIYSIKEEKKDALSDLAKAIEIDVAYKNMAKEEVDFNNLREDEKFQILTKEDIKGM